MTNSTYVSFRACGRQWHIQRANMEELWENMASGSTSGSVSGWTSGTTPGGDDKEDKEDKDERLPYWAELWPSSLGLAQWLGDNKERIAGKACLDMGCGLGFTALVGQWLGGKVTGMDYEAEALRYARINADLNRVPGAAWTMVDWRKPPPWPGNMERVWAGDIMYERSFAKPVASFLAGVLAPRGLAWLAEPGRTIFGALLEELPLHGLKFQKAASWPVKPLIAQEAAVPVTIWEVWRG